MTRRYETPEVSKYGSVESITLANEKCEPGDDEFEDSTGLQGSIQECEPA